MQNVMQKVMLNNVSPKQCPHVLLAFKILLGFDFFDYDCVSKTKKNASNTFGMDLSLTVNYHAHVM